MAQKVLGEKSTSYRAKITHGEHGIDFGPPVPSLQPVLSIRQLEPIFKWNPKSYPLSVSLPGDDPEEVASSAACKEHFAGKICQTGWIWVGPILVSLIQGLIHGLVRFHSGEIAALLCSPGRFLCLPGGF